jgi:hypothetical protein
MIFLRRPEKFTMMGAERVSNDDPFQERKRGEEGRH